MAATLAVPVADSQPAPVGPIVALLELILQDADEDIVVEVARQLLIDHGVAAVRTIAVMYASTINTLCESMGIPPSLYIENAQRVILRRLASDDRG